MDIVPTQISPEPAGCLFASPTSPQPTTALASSVPHGHNTVVRLVRVLRVPFLPVPRVQITCASSTGDMERRLQGEEELQYPVTAET